MKIYLFLLLSISSFRNQKVSGNEESCKMTTFPRIEPMIDGQTLYIKDVQKFLGRFAFKTEKNTMCTLSDTMMLTLLDNICGVTVVSQDSDFAESAWITLAFLYDVSASRG